MMCSGSCYDVFRSVFVMCSGQFLYRFVLHRTGRTLALVSLSLSAARQTMYTNCCKPRPPVRCVWEGGGGWVG